MPSKRTKRRHMRLEQSEMALRRYLEEPFLSSLASQTEPVGPEIWPSEDDPLYENFRRFWLNQPLRGLLETLFAGPIAARRAELLDMGWRPYDGTREEFSRRPASMTPKELDALPEMVRGELERRRDE